MGGRRYGREKQEKKKVFPLDGRMNKGIEVRCLRRCVLPEYRAYSGECQWSHPEDVYVSDHFEHFPVNNLQTLKGCM